MNLLLQFTITFSVGTGQIHVCSAEPILTASDEATINRQVRRIHYDVLLNIHGFKELRMMFKEFVIIHLLKHFYLSDCWRVKNTL